jgi:hypothetical protein
VTVTATAKAATTAKPRETRGEQSPTRLRRFSRLSYVVVTLV